MPLYIDFHQLEGDLTLDDVRAAHAADIENQRKHGVKYLQLWVNKSANTVFCLIEGPDPKACIACHLESHGNTPCNIQEVEEGLLDLYMGRGLLRDKYDMILSPDGESDPASRTLLVVTIERYTNLPTSNAGYNPLVHSPSKALVVECLDKYNGRLLENEPDCVAGVFSSSLNAIGCAQRIREVLGKMVNSAKSGDTLDLRFKLGLNCGPPLTKSKGFFEETLINTKRQTLIARPGQILLASNLRNAYGLNSKKPFNADGIRILTETEEKFIKDIFDFVEQAMHNSKCGVNLLGKQLGTSRSQLYRKILTLTGESPNNFVKEIRLNKACNLLRSGELNISQIALEVGYSNPSHFSKIFRERFGYRPSFLYA